MTLKYEDSVYRKLSVIQTRHLLEKLFNAIFVNVLLTKFA